MCLLPLAILTAYLLRQIAKADEVQPNLPDDQASKWQLVKQTEFNDTELDTYLFSDIYLPHWSELELVRANYVLDDVRNKLLIDQYQKGWRHFAVMSCNFTN